MIQIHKIAYLLAIAALPLVAAVDHDTAAQLAVKRTYQKSMVILTKMSQENNSLYEKVKAELEKILKSDKFMSAIKESAEQTYKDILNGSPFTTSEPWPSLSEFVQKEEPYMKLMYRLLATKVYSQLLWNKLQSNQGALSSDPEANISEKDTSADYDLFSLSEES